MAVERRAGFVTGATKIQDQYEESLLKTNKKRSDWVSVRKSSLDFIKGVKAAKLVPNAPRTELLAIELQQIANTQILVCDLGEYLSDIESRLVKLEKAVDNLTLKIH